MTKNDCEIDVANELLKWLAVFMKEGDLRRKQLLKKVFNKVLMRVASKGANSIFNGLITNQKNH